MSLRGIDAVAAITLVAELGGLGIPFCKYFVFGNPNWDFRTFNFKTDSPILEHKLATALDATDANLAPFERRGRDRQAAGK
jgi:hypothetical protein